MKINVNDMKNKKMKKIKKRHTALATPSMPTPTSAR